METTMFERSPGRFYYDDESRCICWASPDGPGEDTAHFQVLGGLTDRTARQEGIHLATLLNTYCAEHPEAEQFYCEKCGRRCCIDCGETLAGEWPEPWACGACLA